MVYYHLYGDNMKVKIFDEENEEDLENKINDFINDKKIIDIKYQIALAIDLAEQIYCYSAMILYE